MESILRYDKPHCKISYLPSLRAVQLQWIGFANSMAFREACNYSLKL